MTHNLPTPSPGVGKVNLLLSIVEIAETIQYTFGHYLLGAEATSHDVIAILYNVWLRQNAPLRGQENFGLDETVTYVVGDFIGATRRGEWHTLNEILEWVVYMMYPQFDDLMKDSFNLVRVFEFDSNITLRSQCMVVGYNPLRTNGDWS